jgi:hypothetical protein
LHVSDATATRYLTILKKVWLNKNRVGVKKVWYYKDK